MTYSPEVNALSFMPSPEASVGEVEGMTSAPPVWHRLSQTLASLYDGERHQMDDMSVHACKLSPREVEAGGPRSSGSSLAGLQSSLRLAPVS